MISMNPTKIFLPIFLVLLSIEGIAQEDLQVIKPQWVQFSGGENALYKHLSHEAFELLDKRDEAISNISSLEGWKERQAFVKEKLFEIVGPFPEKTPLNAQITRTVEKNGYRIEHVVFESQPGFHVASSLFIPANIDNKAPAIIYCSGHHILAYRNATYQHVILNLVKKGFIVFAIDPVGQGERLEYFDENDNSPTIGGPTKQHSYPGAQAFIAGSSMAKYMIWDGIRAVDYLLSRDEVDPGRIGITGRSGGGTQSSYIAAFDDRIYASAPENYITTFRRLLYTHGPQDAEQNFYKGIKSGLDLPDLLLVRAPKPNMMITTTNDIFNIEGAREAAAEINRIYSAYVKDDNFLMVEDDAGHASTIKNREAMYAFFQKHLDLPGASKDEIADSLSAKELQVTPTGQVLSSYNGLRTLDLNQQLLEKGKVKAVTGNELVEKAAGLSGYKFPEQMAETMMVGRIVREGYMVEKHLMKGEGDYWLPYLLMKPDQETQKAMIYLDPEGKSPYGEPGGELEALVKSGTMVLMPDLLNTGEMGNSAFKGDSNFGGHSYNLWFGSILIGRSIVGIQAGDVNRLARVLKEKEGANQLFGLAKGKMAAVLLHAASFNGDFAGVALDEPMPAYQSIVENEDYESGMIEYTVPGALPTYDLPDLLEYLSQDRKVLIIGNDSGSKRIQDNYPPVNPKIGFAEEKNKESALLEWLK